MAIQVIPDVVKIPESEYKIQQLSLHLAHTRELHKAAVEQRTAEIQARVKLEMEVERLRACQQVPQFVAKFFGWLGRRRVKIERAGKK